MKKNTRGNKNKNVSSLTTIKKELSIDTFRDVHRLINAKPESDLKLFWGDKKFNLSDLNELNRQIQEKNKNHSVVTNEVHVTIFLSDNHILEFNSWTSFENTNWETSPYTESITITWDMTFILPSHALPQQHTLKLKIGSPLKPSEMFEAILTKDDHDIRKEVASAVCTINYVNPIICNELFGIVVEWYRALSTIYPENKLLSSVKNHPERFRTITHSIVLLGGVLCLLGITHVIISYFDFNYEPRMIIERTYQWLLISITVLYTFNLIGTALARWITTKFNKIESLPRFGITKGDKNRGDEIIRKNHKLLREAVFQFLISILILVFGILTKSIFMLIQNIFS